MNNAISPMNSVSFQAKLDVSRVKGSKQRWQNIAKMFEEKTKRYTNDVIRLTGSFNNGLHIELIEGGLLAFDDTSISKKSTQALKEMPDKGVTKNIVDIFKFLRNISPTLVKHRNIAKKLRLDKIVDSSGWPLEYEFYSIMNQVLEADKQKFIKDHPVFHNGGIDMAI